LRDSTAADVANLTEAARQEAGNLLDENVDSRMAKEGLPEVLTAF
jgi:hypothetical protein